MSLDKAIAYNERKAAQYGWSPEWFGCTKFDADLIVAIKKFQSENGLAADGYCGGSTFRRLWTEREQEQEYHQIQIEDTDKKYIVYNNVMTEIFWDKVALWSQEKGKEASTGNYSSYVGQPPRKPRFFVTHWDVCLSSSSCYRVLEKRGISIHFGIDNDGTIYQWLDMQHAGWHCGNRQQNHTSVGVEVSCAYATKYQSWYVKHGFGERPVISNAKVHGKSLKPHLGFYDIQLKALAALWEAVSWALKIPLELPKTKNGVDKDCTDLNFRGFCNHYHLTSRKIDCASLDNQSVLDEAKLLRKKRGGTSE